MLDLKALLAKILERLTTEIVTKTYDLGVITYTAGTIGTTASVKTVNISTTGYTAIGLSITYVSSSIVGFRPFMNQTRDTAYVHVVRAQSSALSASYHAYLVVTYKKS